MESNVTWFIPTILFPLNKFIRFILKYTGATLGHCIVVHSGWSRSCLKSIPMIYFYVSIKIIFRLEGELVTTFLSRMGRRTTTFLSKVRTGTTTFHTGVSNLLEIIYPLLKSRIVNKLS